MKPIAIIFLSILAVSSCYNRPSTSIATEIDITCFDETSVFLNDVQKKKNVKAVHVYGQNLMAEPKDLCIEDTLCYILDANFSISCVNLNNGEIVKQIRTLGNGHNEYIMPQALSCHEGFVYLLDLAKRNVVKYDSQLTPVSNFPTDFTAWDFIKTDKGFLFLSLNDNQGTEIKYTDHEGKEVSSVLVSEIVLDDAPAGNCFIRNEENEIFLKSPFGNDIYKWDEESLEPTLVYTIDYHEHGISRDQKEGSAIVFSDKYHTDTFFASAKTIAFSYINMESRFYGSYDIQDKHINMGTANSPSDSIPFYPRWQTGNYLVGITSCEDMKHGELSGQHGPSCQTVLLFFNINDLCI